MRVPTSSRIAALAGLVLSILVVPRAAGSIRPPAPEQTAYGSLVGLFQEWRAYQAPPSLEGVPDYGPRAMAAQRAGLAGYRDRLEALRSDEWPVAQQIDWHLVRAEMNGLDFDQRVRRPWANDPAFYVMIFPGQSDVPAHEGPVIHGWIDLWTYEYPLSQGDARELARQIGAIPAVLEQARGNLVGESRDLWHRAVGSLRRQSADLVGFGEGVAGTRDDLDTAVGRAIAATDSFVQWLESRATTKTGPSGVGKDNYTWLLQNVHYLPYTWEQLVTLMRRELWRSHAALRLEENRNRDLPGLTRYETAQEYDAALNRAVTEYMEFLGEEEILSIRPYMDGALRERIERFSPVSPPDSLRGFFSEVQYRDGEVMRTHGHHWFDLARMRFEPHASAIRRVPLLYNLWDARSEGLATSVEEMMLHAGFLDDRPRARELIWILLAQRAARALGGLMMHANEWSMQEAVEFASEWTPRGWMPPDSATVWGEQHLYLQQPVYGVSYLIGKIEIEKLLAERAIQLGDEFSIGRFFDEFHAVGVIPVSLVRWELTGQGEEISAMTAGIIAERVGSASHPNRADDGRLAF